MSSRAVHIYMPEEDADLVKAASLALGVSETALYRGALKHLTKDFTDFSTARDWLDYRPRGRRAGDGKTTGSEVNDVSWNLIRHSAHPGLVQQMNLAMELIEGGANIEEALNTAFPTVATSDPLPTTYIDDEEVEADLSPDLESRI